MGECTSRYIFVGAFALKMSLFLSVRFTWWHGVLRRA